MNASLAQAALRELLAPMVRFCLRHGLKLQDLTEMAKEQFVLHAGTQLDQQAIAVSDSRISLMTGVHRKDVRRLSKEDHSPRSSSNVISRVIALWQTDPRFTTSKNRPRTLSCNSAESEFAQLARSVSRELNPYTVLFELERIGAAERTSKGLKLKRSMFVAKDDSAEGLRFLATDIDDLIAAVEENIAGIQPENLHIKTQYDSIPKSRLAEVQDFILREGSAFHRKIRNFLAGLDTALEGPQTSASESDDPESVRVAVGTFSRTDPAVGDTFHEL